jgi:hypothetical protein
MPLLLLVAAALLAACGGGPAAAPSSTPQTTATTAVPTTTTTKAQGGAARSVVYFVTGTVPSVTYIDTLGEEKTEPLGPVAFVHRSVLPAGDTARVEGRGGSSTTGVSCSIRVDGHEVASQSSYDASVGVVCSARIP